MKRFAPVLLALLAIAACDDDNTANPPDDAPWTCADLEPSSEFSWRVDPVLDTLVAITVETSYPASPCSTEICNLSWRDTKLHTFRNDSGGWSDLPDSRLRYSSTLTSDDWAAHGDTLIVRWHIRYDFGPNDGCGEEFATFLTCPGNYDTLVVSDLLPSRQE